MNEDILDRDGGADLAATACFFRRRFIDINKQYIQDSRKERHKKHSQENNKERKRDKPEASIVYIYAKLSGIDLIEKFSLYDQKIYDQKWMDRLITDIQSSPAGDERSSVWNLCQKQHELWK